MLEKSLYDILNVLDINKYDEIKQKSLNIANTSSSGGYEDKPQARRNDFQRF